MKFSSQIKPISYLKSHTAEIVFDILQPGPTALADGLEQVRQYIRFWSGQSA